MMKIRVLGIDPGLTETGWGIVDCAGQKLEYIASGTICSKASMPLSERLLNIYNCTQKVILEFAPQRAAIENTYVSNNYESSLKLAHARAAAMLSMAIAGIALEEYQAKTVKKSILGSGNSQKEQVQVMLKYLLGGLIVKNHNEADAIAIAICHANHLR